MKFNYHLIIFFAVTFSSAAFGQDSTPPANEVLKQAYRKAAAEKKNVFVMFHASWCGWCRKMDSSMNDSSVKDLFTGKYVITHLTVYESKEKKMLENPGAMDILTKYKGIDLGIPYWIIFDKDGNWLADSQARPEGSDFNFKGENVGCPASSEEVNHFLSVLRKTSTLTSDQLSAVEKRFLRNK